MISRISTWWKWLFLIPSLSYSPIFAIGSGDCNGCVDIQPKILNPYSPLLMQMRTWNPIDAQYFFMVLYYHSRTLPFQLWSLSPGPHSCLVTITKIFSLRWYLLTGTVLFLYFTQYPPPNLLQIKLFSMFFKSQNCILVIPLHKKPFVTDLDTLHKI